MAEVTEKAFDLDAAIAAAKATALEESKEAVEKATKAQQDRFEKGLPDFQGILGKYLTQEDQANLGITFHPDDCGLNYREVAARFQAKGIGFKLSYLQLHSDSYDFDWQLTAYEIFDESAPDFDPDEAYDEDRENFFLEQWFYSSWDLSDVVLFVDKATQGYADFLKRQQAQKAKAQEPQKPSQDELITQRAIALSKRPASTMTLFDHYVALAMSGLAACPESMSARDLAACAIDIAKAQLKALAEELPAPKTPN